MPGEGTGVALGESVQGDEDPVVAGVPGRSRRELRARRRQDQQGQIRP
jgi:hypothetical protein